MHNAFTNIDSESTSIANSKTILQMALKELSNICTNSNDNDLNPVIGKRRRTDKPDSLQNI